MKETQALQSGCGAMFHRPVLEPAALSNGLPMFPMHIEITLTKTLDEPLWVLPSSSLSRPAHSFEKSVRTTIPLSLPTVCLPSAPRL